MITKISTVDMDREMWLSKRRGSIGGSDAAAVLGLDTFRSPYALWCEKTGRIVPEDIGDREAVRLGLDLEQYVARRWMEQTGRKVRRDNHMIYNSRYPFAHANIDHKRVEAVCIQNHLVSLVGIYIPAGAAQIDDQILAG